MVTSLRAHPFRIYILLTFLLSWLVWIPLALNDYSLLPVHLDQGIVSVLPLLGTLGPALAASLVALRMGGKPAVKELWSQLRRWRVSWTWYAAAVLVFPVLIFVVAWIYPLLFLGAELPYKNLSPSTFLVTIIFLTVSVIGEEVGWRGFALPQLQKHWSAFQASVLLGTVHTIWHLPFWTALGELRLFGWTYWILSWAWVLALTIYLTWVMNNTGNSLFLALLLHLSLNIVMVRYLPITTVVPAYILLIAIAWFIMLGILVRYGSKRMVRLAA
jgi:membrane protease YdiL (CAAX protease family)